MVDKTFSITWAALERAYENRIANLRAAMDVAHYQAGNLAVSRRVIEQALISDREAGGKPPANLQFWLEYNKSAQKALIAEAVAAERERCASRLADVAKHLARPWGSYLTEEGIAVKEACAARVEQEAAAIREGGEHG
ncbi:hypothetical protein [Asaia spathodeae]|uniref:Uncharacterized protein n=1 Tax=Asaia spathodeae TaxID=657016 RepID=A0ABX2P7R7_9PROT|nr:hypothetical protein [Asaia spathodeae]GBR20960.1 hypothetical protein AA105894_2679 [Asaia spathodeae NBRC 105894]